MRSKLVILNASLLALTLVAAPGCDSSPSMGKYDVQVSLDRSMMRPDRSLPTVEIDLVGVNPNTGTEQWDQLKLTQYFTPGNAMRAGASRSPMIFTRDSATTQTLSRKDPIWQTWKDAGVMSMYVLASLPGVHEDKLGAADERRLIVPLDRRRWDVSTLQIVVKESGLSLATPPKPVPTP